MRFRILFFGAALLVPGVLSTEPVTATQSDPAWRILCSDSFRVVSKKVKLRPGGNPTEVTNSIQLCTKHVYEFSGKAGRRIKFRLRGNDGSWMILSPKNDRVLNQEYHNRVFSETREWDGVLPSNTRYALTVVTIERVLTPYTLELKYY